MRPFLRDPKRYRFCDQGNAAKTAGMRKRQCWTEPTIFRSPPKTGWRNSRARSRHRDENLLKRLFHPDSYWRDVLALSWNIQTINGADAILK